MNLPLFDDPAETKEQPRSARPSIDAARARLGGRVIRSEQGEPAALAPGLVVTFPSGPRGSDTPRVPGVVLFAGAAEVHVLLDSIRLRRLRPEDLEPHAGNVDVELGKIAADARFFGLLSEGAPVRYADDAGDLVDGRVVEKCRWGALVLRDDGSIVAVGFRKLWPSTDGGHA